MRTLIFSIFICLLAVGCTNKSTRFLWTDDTEQSQNPAIKDSDLRYSELDSLLFTDIETRDLGRAKELIQQLKTGDPENIHLHKDLSFKQRWVDESIKSRVEVQSLSDQIAKLKAEVLKHQHALEEVRRTLVSE